MTSALAGNDRISSSWQLQAHEVSRCGAKGKAHLVPRKLQWLRELD
jgi:hypothetical protein